VPSPDHAVRDIFHRIGTLEATTNALRADAVAHEIADQRSHDDHEARLRDQEQFKAKVFGAAAFGSGIVTLIGWLLNYAR
jgi:hypothetical protein